MVESKVFKLPKEFQITLVNKKATGAVVRNIAIEKAATVSGTAGCVMTGPPENPNDFQCSDTD